MLFGAGWGGGLLLKIWGKNEKLGHQKTSFIAPP